MSTIRWQSAFLHLTRQAAFLLLLTAASLQAQLVTTPAGCGDVGCTVSVPFGHSLPRPFDSPEVWMHGHHQRPSSYAGYSAFRPYNYRHVAAQARLTSAWPVAHGAPYALSRPAVSVSFQQADRRGLLQRLSDPAAVSSPAGFASASRSGVHRSPAVALRPASRHALRPVPAANDLPVHVFPRLSAADSIQTPGRR
ncbi:MAG: hypothetical protein NXI04_19165 [Planctomycetaceae bacterium]|nr:hypothetical protein [Planctomycetaceae bacterium]